MARAAIERIDHVWSIITSRIQQNSEYVEQFISSFDHLDSSANITIADIANSLVEFISHEWQSLDSLMD